ncbi:heme/copper-type cytochrome/quinol oxidase subunit 1 [Bradyrhizobium sp. F1.13.4]
MSIAAEPNDLRDDVLNGLQLSTQLERVWRTPSGWMGALMAVDHKVVGRRYIVTAFVFLLLGGILAVLMRVQLAGPEKTFLSADKYNQVFTMHGSTMMFLFAVPVMEAFAVYLVPLMVGTRNIAFPRLNAFSYWMFLFGGCFLWISFLFNVGPDVGWFSYVPLSSLQFTPTKRADVWAQMITFTEVAALAVAVEIVVTVFKLRAPGMTLDRIPLFVWAMLVTAFLVMFAMPSIMVASTSLILDRLVNTRFYDSSSGGHPLLWQHLFWFFGHPEVYIIFIPGTGMVSAILATFARRPVIGYPVVILSLIATGFLSFGLWVHHMFVTGLPQLGAALFTASSMLIAVPSGLQIFCWLATLWDGRPVYRTPLLFVIGFIVIFVLGGLSGVMVASVPIDTQVHDTYFVVAHFHYVLIGGAVFPLIGAVYYWFSQDRGPHAERKTWALELLARLHRLQRRVLSHAHPRADWDAAPGLHLHGRHGLGAPEPLVQRRCADFRAQLRVASGQCDLQPAQGRARRRQSLGCLDAGMGDLVATSAAELRPHSGRQAPRSAVGR